MKSLFQKRRHDFLRRCAKYLRYVLNDHFVLVLMVFIGFLSLQYRQLLLHFPENPLFVIVAVFVVSLMLLFSGKIATYLEEADQVFLLSKELDVLQEMNVAARRTFFLWSVFQVLAQLLMAPIYLKLGLEIWMISICIAVLVGVKYILVMRQLASYQLQGLLNWSKAIQAEQKRKQSILRFFALFTTVKGISSTVKPRSYLNGFLRFFKARQTWFYLYLRAYIRAADYFGLTLRLLLLAIISLVAIDESWLSIGLVLVFHYLLLFQLLGLYKHFDYQYLNQLYPLNRKDKIHGFQRLLRIVLYALLMIETAVALLCSKESVMIVLLLFVGFFLHEVYLPVKIKKLID